jgi:4-aminobutyrate aminotransferase/(S)-3-amino-2-methylpropionate transaminase
VVFDHAYHGRTNLTMALTAKNMPYKHGFGPFAPEVYRVPMSYRCRRRAGRGRGAARPSTDREAGRRGQRRRDLIEPIQGEGGFVVPARASCPRWPLVRRRPGRVRRRRDPDRLLPHRRSGSPASTRASNPDLITTAKGIAGGLPLAAVTGRAEIMDAVHAGGLGGTYGGNPIACAAALAAIETMRELDLNAAARRIEALSCPADRHGGEDPGIGEVRGRGAMLAIELVKDRHAKEPDPLAHGRARQGLPPGGLLVLTCGTYGNVLRFLPPLVIGEDLLNEGLDIIEQAFARI